MTTGITPIFVLGAARNGTTWLGNELAAHPGIAGVEHTVHWGQMENRAGMMWRQVGKIDSDRRLIPFVELYASTDFFRAAGADKAVIYREKPKHVFDVFFSVMDQCAEKQGTHFWVTKLDPTFLHHPEALTLFLKHLNNRYDHVKWVGIQRNFDKVLASYLRMEGMNSIHQLPLWKRYPAVVLETARYASHYHGINRILQTMKGLRLDFNQFKANHEAQMQAVWAYLDIEAPPLETRSNYQPNSSFAVSGRKSDVSGLFKKLAVKVLLPMFRTLPGPVHLMLRQRDKARRNLIPYYWRLLRLETMPESLAEEWRRTGQHALYDLVFDENGKVKIKVV